MKLACAFIGIVFLFITYLMGHNIGESDAFLAMQGHKQCQCSD
jgi:hypothetical protein